MRLAREAGTVKIAIMAPLVTAIREPQQGGSQAFVSDLARGLAGRGHDVHVYAASGSQIPGVEVIDTGVDPRSLAGTLYRAFGPAPRREPAAAEAAFARAYDRVQQVRYDVIHNHAFDAPAVRLATALHAPVVHTLHLPPGRGGGGGAPPCGPVRPAAGGGRRVGLPGGRLAPDRPRRRDPAALRAHPRHPLVAGSRGRRRLRGQAESREGRRRGHRHRPRGRSADRRLRRRL